VTELPRNVGAITMFIEDVQRSKKFYETVFDVAPIYEDENAVAFSFDNTVINLLRTPAAHELIEPALVGRQEGGSRFQLTIGVDDCDSVCAELASRGDADQRPDGSRVGPADGGVRGSGRAHLGSRGEHPGRRRERPLAFRLRDVSTQIQLSRFGGSTSFDSLALVSSHKHSEDEEG
jgi:predicted enzyme related to lactoylglutathione lyase